MSPVDQVGFKSKQIKVKREKRQRVNLLSKNDMGLYLDWKHKYLPMEIHLISDDQVPDLKRHHFKGAISTKWRRLLYNDDGVHTYSILFSSIVLSTGGINLVVHIMYSESIHHSTITIRVPLPNPSPTGYNSPSFL